MTASPLAFLQRGEPFDEPGGCDYRRSAFPHTRRTRDRRLRWGFEPGRLGVSRVTEQLAERASGFRIVAPAVPPVIGAYFLALKVGGIPVGAELLARVTDQVRSLPAITSKTPVALPDQH